MDLVTPERFRHCLHALRWRPAAVAEALACDERLVRNWYSGRMAIPARVAAWVETLARHAEQHPAPDDWRVHRGYSASAAAADT